MAIRVSSSAQVNSLVSDLASPTAVTRDAAVARLTVIGARAVERLCEVALDGPADARVAALRALEAIGSPRSLAAAIAALDSSETAAPAIALLRRLLAGPKETTAIEALTAVALDRTRSSSIRIAAAQALADLGPAAFKPLSKEFGHDPDPELREWLAGTQRRATPGRPRPSDAAPLEALIERGLPDDPAAVRRAIAKEGARAPLTALRSVVEATRAREESAPARQRAEWASARAAAHAALANRGSRVALYDVRESIEKSAGPLAVEFLAAVAAIGDASCLEPLAAAYARSTRSGEDWWRQHLRHAFHTIVQRDRITRRHAAMKKVLARWPAILAPTGSGAEPAAPGR